MSLISKKYNLKEKIITILKNSKQPNSVKALQHKLHQQYNKTSVYRQLEVLFKTGKVHKIQTGRESLFEISRYKHAHFYCIKCNFIHCLPLPKNFELNIEGLENMEVLDTNIDIKGLCDKCKNIAYA